MMGYLKWKHNSHLFFDPTYPTIDFDSFNNGAEWKELYGEVTEPVPDNDQLTFVCELIVTTTRLLQTKSHA